MLHHIVFRSAGGPTTRENLITLCARCHGLVHEGFLHIERSDGAPRLLDRAGRPLHAQHVVPAAIRIAACAVAHAAPTNGHEVMPLRSEADIPEVVDSAWWLAHEHELAWTGIGLRVRRHGERRAS